MNKRIFNKFKRIAFVVVFITMGTFSQLAYSTCILQASNASLPNVWTRAENNPIGPSNLNILAQRFQPAGTVLFDQVFPMTTLLNASANTVVIACTQLSDMNYAGAALRLDDTYQFQSFVANGITYYYTGYTPGSSYHNPVGYKLYGIMPDGTQRELIYNDSGAPSNTAVRYAPLTYKSCTSLGTLSAAYCNTYPYVITASDFPKIRLVLVRSPYDNDTSLISDRRIGRIGWILSQNGTASDSDYGYITLNSEFHTTAGPACGITQVPQVVALGTQSVSTIAGGGLSWSPFTVTYECSTTGTPVSTLRIGFEPQNRGSLLSSDYHYLQPDASANTAAGVGIIYRRSGETLNRYWIQNSGCVGISTEMQNNSNCALANSQTQSQGWYTANPVSSGLSSTAGYTQYTENFEASMALLPNTVASDVASGQVTSTVNVLVNQP